MTFTAADMHDQIITGLGEMADEFNIDAIETEIRENYGEFQAIAARHAIETEA